MSWNEIGERHGTDKARHFNGAVGHGYLEAYERILADVKVRRLMEVGVLRGASLRTWADIWPDAYIYGMDCDAYMPADPYPENVRVYQADVRDDLSNMLTGIAPFDVIIDDASHQPDQIEVALGSLVPALRPGGFYFVEDVGHNDACSVEQAVLYLVGAGLRYIEPVPAWTAETGGTAMVVGRKP